jgi:dTDP-glucose 4,6-dehydratase
MTVSENDLEHVLGLTKDLWPPVAGKRIFVTGGTGFFGKWLLESFDYCNEKLALEASMVVLSRDPASFAESFPHLAERPGIEFHKGDVRSFGFPPGDFDFVIHAAAQASATLNAEEPLLVIDAIVTGTKRVLEFAQNCGAGRLLFASSGAVYGAQPPEVTNVPEDYAGAPDTSEPASAYGEAKRLAELLCSIWREKFGIETVIARGFAFVGPYLNLDIHYAVGNFIRDGLAKGPIRVLGDGTPLRSYLYAADLAAWLWTMLLGGKSGRAYNVGSDEAISIGDLARRVSGCFKHRPEVVIAREPAEGPVRRYVPSIERARNELGLRVWTGLDEAIERTIEFYRAESSRQ